ncbi:hypothetical protein [Streptomyces sp. MK7]|uniref:hypothetical protein n=1 Tax=Streptomyces sp. MK7 TaxID=3067635 RepID=UPI0029301DF2|nr:hypothetical protein [Streptomyces sp. MK7]
MRTLPRIMVFARVTPAHKVRIVTTLRSVGWIVAVTGGGANDAPAIRIAHVGIAFDSRATPAACSAADVVVTNGRIETIVEGRAMWVSVRKAPGVLLGNLGEIAFTLATSLLTGHSAPNARQLLLVNLLTDMVPAMNIAARPPADRAGKLRAEGPRGFARRGSHAPHPAVCHRHHGGGHCGLRGRRGDRNPGARRRRRPARLVTSQLFQGLQDAGRDPVVAAAVMTSLMMRGMIVTVPGLSHLFGSRPPGLNGLDDRADVGDGIRGITHRGDRRPPSAEAGNMAPRKERVHLQVM